MRGQATCSRTGSMCEFPLIWSDKNRTAVSDAPKAPDRHGLPHLAKTKDQITGPGRGTQAPLDFSKSICFVLAQCNEKLHLRLYCTPQSHKDKSNCYSKRWMMGLQSIVGQGSVSTMSSDVFACVCLGCVSCITASHSVDVSCC